LRCIPYLEEIMTIKHVSRFMMLLAVCFVSAAYAQQVLVLPGASATADTFSVFTPQPFAVSRTIKADTGAFLAFINPAGTRYYIVTPSKVIVSQMDGTQVQSISIGQAVNGAALAPDGSRLVVAAGTASAGSVTIFDVSGDGATQVASLTSITYPLDVAISLDSATAYVINTAGITPVDLGNNTAGTLVALPGLTPSGTVKPGVSVGPNGLFYVNASNALYELNPATLATTGTITLVGFPGKPSFWTDATAAVAVNQKAYSLSTSEPRAWVFDMTKRAISRTMADSSQEFAQAFYASAAKIYVTSPKLDRLFSFPPTSTRSLTPVGTGVSSAVLSTEPTTPKYLFVATTDKLIRYAVVDDSSASQNLSTTPGATFYVQPAIHGNEATLQTFNATQSLARGATALPLVVRVLSAQGLPVSGIAVKWVAGSAITLSNAVTTTNAQGYAVATAIAPKSDGTYPVYARFPDSAVLGGVTFTLTVSGSSSGGGGGTSTAEGLSMVTGNGQVLMGGSLSISPLEVLATDSSGAAVSGATVTFTIGANQGALASATGLSHCAYTSATVMTCTTDTNGHASVLFQPLALSAGTANVVSTITASTTTASSTANKTVTFYETTLPSAQVDNSVTPFPTVTITDSATARMFTGTAGSTISGALKAQILNPSLANVGIAIRSTAAYVADAVSPASCSGAGGTALSNASGLATCNLVLGPNAGTYYIYVIVGEYVASPYILNITPAPVVTPVPTTIVLTTGDGTSAVAGDTVNLVGTVKDQTGKIMSGTAVTWTVAQGDATITSKSATTNTSGQATAAVKIGSAGAIQIKLAAGTVSNLFHITGTLSVSDLTIVSGNPQSAAIGAAFDAPLVVKVSYASGPAVSFPVVFTATSGVTLSASSVNTDSNGLASVTVTAGDTATSAQVVATAGGKTQTFNLTVRPPGPALTPGAYLNGASFASNFISFGSIATIKTVGLTTGLNLAPGSCLTDGTIDGLPTTGGLPTRIAGVEFQFGSKLAPIFAICKNADGTEQANVQVPFDVAPGTVWGIVRYGAGTSSPTEFGIPNVQLLNAAPGIFEYYVSGSTLGAIAVRPDGSVVSPTNGAKAGETIEVYVTGLGPVLPTAKSNVPGMGEKTYFTPTVKLGDKDLASVTATYARNGIGIYLVTFQIPSDQAASASVPLVIGVVKNDKTTAVSQTSHIAIQ
jgi:uncharacterized protein (TIGR03437 family)